MNTSSTNANDPPDDGEGRIWMKVYFEAEPPSLGRILDDMKALENIRQIPFHQRLNRKPWER